MTDKPVIGQIGRTDRHETIKIEILGELLPSEWKDFVECLKACIARWPKLTIHATTYKVSMEKSFPKK